MLHGYRDGDKLERVYTFDFLNGYEERDIAEEAYRLLNIEHPADYHYRSLSVGDLVLVEEGEGRPYVVFAVAPIGFTDVTNKFQVCTCNDPADAHDQDADFDGEKFKPEIGRCTQCECQKFEDRQYV